MVCNVEGTDKLFTCTHFVNYILCRLQSGYSWLTVNPLCLVLESRVGYSRRYKLRGEVSSRHTVQHMLTKWKLLLLLTTLLPPSSPAISECCCQFYGQSNNRSLPRLMCDALPVSQRWNMVKISGKRSNNTWYICTLVLWYELDTI